MSSLNAALLAILTSSGVVLICLGLLRKLPDLSPPERSTPGPVTEKERLSPAESVPSRLFIAASASAFVFLTTGWPVAAVALGTAGYVSPSLVLAKRYRRQNIDRIEAIATWIEGLRDTMAGSAGLQQALHTTARVAPEPIRSEVRDLSLRLQHRSVVDALQGFARDLDDPLGDMVVSSLILATARSGGSLTPVLASTAQAARDTAAMWRHIEAGRAGAYSQAKLAGVVSGLLVVSMVIFRRSFLEPFGTLVGQTVMAAICLAFFGSAYAMYRIGIDAPPERPLKGIEHWDPTRAAESRRRRNVQ